MHYRYHIQFVMALIMLNYPVFSAQHVKRDLMETRIRSQYHGNIETREQHTNMLPDEMEELRGEKYFSQIGTTTGLLSSPRTNPDIIWSRAEAYAPNNTIRTIVDVYEGWDGTQWVNFNRYTTTYDVHGNQTESLSEDWDGTQWVINYRYTSTYDVHGNQTESLSEDWDGTQWVINSRYTSTYDVNGNRTEYLLETWDGAQWVANTRHMYTYDMNGNPTESLLETWDGTQWIARFRYMYTYDMCGNKTKSVVEDWDGAQWVIEKRHTYEYTWYVSTATVPSNIRMIPEKYDLLPAYPNPFNPETTIQCNLPAAGNTSVIIYDLSGREVYRLVDGYKDSGQYKIRWCAIDASGQQLPSGVYIARLATPEYSKSIKMVLLK
ncbi:T9SS type A sorting domain-containing protein [Candidatus Neomarinimicrobiota bacterium]